MAKGRGPLGRLYPIVVLGVSSGLRRKLWPLQRQLSQVDGEGWAEHGEEEDETPPLFREKERKEDHKHTRRNRQECPW